MNELTIFIFDAEEGMELSRDVILNDGSVLLTKGTGSGFSFSLKKFQKIFYFLKPPGVFFRLGGVKGAKNTV